MPALIFSPAIRKEKRSEAHHLDPVVMIGSDGLTAAVIKETEAALNAHGLIKIRVLDAERDDREAMLATLCDKLNAAPIQHIGKLLVIYRAPLLKEKPVDENRMKGPKFVKLVENSSRGGNKPRVTKLKVLGNERLTSSGTVKRAKKRVVSTKRKAQAL